MMDVSPASESVYVAMSQSPKFEPLQFEHLTLEEQRLQSASFLARMLTRRTVSQYSSEPVPLELITNAVATAGTAPSPAWRQPWHFVVVSGPAVKQRIRQAAEAEERENFERRMSRDYVEAHNAVGRTWQKPYLEDAPYLVVVFAQTYEVKVNPITGHEVKNPNFYVTEAVGFAIGILVAAFHQAGLATSIDTPSPMGFLNDILQRPANERPYLIMSVGYPAPDAQVPVMALKPLEEIMTHVGDEGDR
jgi:nitroreductase